MFRRTLLLSQFVYAGIGVTDDIVATARVKDNAIHDRTSCHVTEQGQWQPTKVYHVRDDWIIRVLREKLPLCAHQCWSVRTALEPLLFRLVVDGTEVVYTKPVSLDEHRYGKVLAAADTIL